VGSRSTRFPRAERASTCLNQTKEEEKKRGEEEMRKLMNKIVIAENERALLFRRGSFERILGPGVHWVGAFTGRIRVDRFDLTTPVFVHELGEFLVKTHPELIETTFSMAELGDDEVGLVYVDGKLADVVAPASRLIFWRGVHDVRVEVQDISEDFAVPASKVSLLGHLRNVDRTKLAASIEYAEVPDNTAGLLLVNGRLDRVLDTGAYAFWKYNRTIQVKYMDTRLQSMEVQGQEILTKDKVSLRLNLSATLRVVDAARAFTALKDFGDFLYKELQFALREAVATKTLDELLARKDELASEIEGPVRERATPYGVELEGVGIKDVILPGDMKTILNRVVEAEKEAEANLIRRREEAAATRSLNNTAQMLDRSPTLLRLKELETLEKVTERIDKLTVYGGLEGLLTQLVSITGSAKS
jgi:regulator of protease activity HflC (stomatin/prohibitin superfamily)